MFGNKKFRVNKSNKEAGYGVVVVIVVLFFLCVAVFAALAASMRASASLENLDLRDDEKWQAKSALTTMRRVLEVRIPQKHETHLTEAQNCLRSMNMPNANFPVFDQQEASPDASVPVLRVETDGRTSCNQSSGYSAVFNYTSLLGNTNTWAASILPLLEQEAYNFGYRAEMLKTAQLTEQLRRFNSSGDPVYVFGFIIDSRGGQHFRLRENGEVALGDISQNCGATGRLEIAPRTVQQGNPVTFRITYMSVNRLRIYNSANTLLHEETVIEQSDPQIFEWNYTPGATDSYRVEALSSDSGCYSRSEWIQIQVTSAPPAPCVVIDSLNAAPDTVMSGEQSTISWSVRNASEVTLDGEIVPATGSRTFTILSERIFTLNGRDAANSCPSTRQVTVRMTLAPCLTPAVSQFEVAPSPVAPGDSVTITWQVANVMPGGTVNITLPDGTILSNVGASGTRTVNAPSSTGTFNYSITASNPCGTTASQTRQLQVNNSCVSPLITDYRPNPSTVTAGGNQTVRLSWTTTGTVDSAMIAGIGDVTGRSFVDITQPQTTTDYPLTVNGCSVPANRNATVTVTTGTPGPSYSCPSFTAEEQVCANTVGCATARLNGSVNNDGARATGSFTFSGGLINGENFSGISFVVTDSESRVLTQGGVVYDQNTRIPRTEPANPVGWNFTEPTVNFDIPVLPGATSGRINVNIIFSYRESTTADPIFNSADLCGGGSGGSSCQSRTETGYYCDAYPNTRFTKSLIAQITPEGANTYRVIVPQPEFASGSSNVFTNGSYTIYTSNGTSTIFWSDAPSCSPSANVYCYDGPNSPRPAGRFMPFEVVVSSVGEVSVQGNYQLYRGDNCESGGDRTIGATFIADTGNCNPDIIIGYNNSPSFFEYALNLKGKNCGLPLAFIH